MSRRTTITALTALLVVSSPSLAAAVDDGDTLAGDPAGQTVVFAADGSTETGTTALGDGAFVKLLLARGASGSKSEATAGYSSPTIIRTGYSKPATRLAPINRATSRRAALKTITRVVTREPDGQQTIETGFARNIATGRLRRVSIGEAERLSADPRGGTPGTAWFYSRESDLPVFGG